ncbi:MAG: T9SS type A sorting domain-containing protein [Bacteroidota bacterium]
MKKVYTIIAVLGLLNAANAQTIVSADMETWNTYKSGSIPVTMEKPTGWASSDSVICPIVYLMTSSYTPRVSKSTTVFHSTTTSAKLETPSTDTFPTLITNAAIKINLTTYAYSYSGGTPVTKRINFVKSWAQYQHGSANDTGRMLVYATKVGIAAGGKDSVIGQGEADITSTSTFLQKTVYIKYVDATTVPDRIIVAFQSSRLAVRPAGTILYVDDVTISDPTGIETPLINDENIKVFPNPALNQLHISADINESLNIVLYNTTGQAVLHQQINQEADINVSALSAGNYVYVISGTDGHKFYSATFTKL